MSYCRWSSMDFECDVYCYESVGGGYVVHVATNRRERDEKKPPLWNENIDEGWLQHHEKVMAWLDTAESKPIGLSRDGEIYSIETPKDAADLLQSLKDEGYNVPDYAIEALRSESGQ